MSNQPPIEESELTRQVMAEELDNICINPQDLDQLADRQMLSFAADELRQSCDGCFHFPPRVADSSDFYSGFRCAAGQSCEPRGYCHLWQDEFRYVKGCVRNLRERQRA